MQAPKQKRFAIYFGDLRNDEACAYARFYKDGENWFFKPVHTYREASKFATEAQAKRTARNYSGLREVGFITTDEPIEENEKTKIKIFKLSTSTPTYQHTITFEIDEENQKATLKNFCRDDMGVMSFLNGKVQQMTIEEARAEYKKLLNGCYSKA